MIITIDGPAGSGKSTVARKLAARLEIPYLDTGAMYRAVAYAAVQREVNLEDEVALIQMVERISLDLDCGPTHTRVRVDGHDVSEAIRSMEISCVVSQVAMKQRIRSLLVTHQRSLGERLKSFIAEGRDQGGVVFPNADMKFVFSATLEKRAERRYQELSVDGEDVTLALVRDNLHARDLVDQKQWEPLVSSGEATVIDTTNLSVPQVVDSMIEILQDKCKEPWPDSNKACC